MVTESFTLTNQHHQEEDLKKGKELIFVLYNVGWSGRGLKGKSIWQN